MALLQYQFLSWVTALTVDCWSLDFVHGAAAFEVRKIQQGDGHIFLSNFERDACELFSKSWKDKCGGAIHDVILYEIKINNLTWAFYSLNIIIIFCFLRFKVHAQYEKNWNDGTAIDIIRQSKDVITFSVFIQKENENITIFSFCNYSFI